MGTVGVLSRVNSMCKGPVVGGSRGHRRTWQSCGAREGVMRNEAEMGQGSRCAPVAEIIS